MIEPIDEKLKLILDSLQEDNGIHTQLPGGSVLHIERPLPFLCLYRYPKGDTKTPVASLLNTQPAYLLLQEVDLSLAGALLNALAEAMQKRFGAFLILEIWQTKEQQGIWVISDDNTNEQFLSTLKKELFAFPLSLVQEVQTSQVFPEDYVPLLSRELLHEESIRLLGLQLSSFYLSPTSGKLYPMIYRQFRKELATALQKFFFDFVRVQTHMDVTHYHGLGRHKVDELVWKVDQELVAISKSFDFLLLTSVINHTQAWEEFKRKGYEQRPSFLYRMIPIDPELLKRQLYQVPIEKVEDPTLAFIFRDKRKELERLISMLEERNTPDFHLTSIQVFGGVEEELLEKAVQILAYNAGADDSDDDEAEDDAYATASVSTEAFAEMARQEIDWMRQQYPQLDATVSIQKDITGLMVSSGQLLIGEGFTTTPKRAEALIQHEVGTHVLTYYNGKAQPLQQMFVGSPGYEDLQEGLAVLAEYLVGGLTLGRLRTLAGRVVAVDSMLGNADFTETFRLLHKTHGFSAYTAYGITERVYRGGGMTKDAVYLRGLLHLLDHLAQGHALQPLLIGKIRQDYLPLIDELIQRKILRPAPITPRYFSNSESQKRLKALTTKADILSLINT